MAIRKRIPLDSSGAEVPSSAFQSDPRKRSTATRFCLHTNPHHAAREPSVVFPGFRPDYEYKAPYRHSMAARMEHRYRRFLPFPAARSAA